MEAGQSNGENLPDPSIIGSAFIKVTRIDVSKNSCCLINSGNFSHLPWILQPSVTWAKFLKQCA